MRRHTTKLDAETLDWVMRVNFMAPARMALALLPRMLERGQGMIVNVSSVAGRLGNANEAAYSASKFALCGWSEAIAVDLWGTGVSVRLVNPGPIDTEIWDLPGNDDPLFDVPKVSAADMADAIVEAMEGDVFETYFPDMKGIIEMKTSDPDSFIRGMAEGVKAVKG
jgi:short-subunit dehydrogenase